MRALATSGVCLRISFLVCDAANFEHQRFRASVRAGSPLRKCLSSDLRFARAMAGCCIRIGPARFEYYYERETANVWNGSRGSDMAAKDERLVLVREDGFWVAYDVKIGVAREHGVPVWRTVDDAITGGDHKWQINRTRFHSNGAQKQVDWTDAELTCTTVPCSPSAISRASSSRDRSRSPKLTKL